MKDELGPRLVDYFQGANPFYPQEHPQGPLTPISTPDEGSPQLGYRNEMFHPLWTTQFHSLCLYLQPGESNRLLSSLSDWLIT